jgi:hypothetical protein
MKASFAALLACVALLAIADAALAWGTVRGAGRVLTDCDAKNTGSPRIVDGQDNCSRSRPEEIGEKGGDGARRPAGAQGDQGPEGENGEPGADGDKGAHGATGPSGAQKGPWGDHGASDANSDSGLPRAPPAVLSALRTGPGS